MPHSDIGTLMACITKGSSQRYGGVSRDGRILGANQGKRVKSEMMILGSAERWYRILLIGESLRRLKGSRKDKCVPRHAKPPAFSLMICAAASTNTTMNYPGRALKLTPNGRALFYTDNSTVNGATNHSCARIITAFGRASRRMTTGPPALVEYNAMFHYSTPPTTSGLAMVSLGTAMFTNMLNHTTKPNEQTALITQTESVLSESNISLISSTSSSDTFSASVAVNEEARLEPGPTSPSTEALSSFIPFLSFDNNRCLHL
ncbi:uncharacterized protein BDR25DRAFT_350778 [Lindgomyces ingoldianus]|uniref:Uncharacterized protein n=1 Tax=Lindgomyces ingoldianus TaxID=673940 RepID=A0ACB6RAP7_9PLEO|nr:uncharacterized protein BDR25DRAFT_350778 [Lindgomyces ingoldianus]KAF2475402.1 hypothetical protein BDR25DRAFT_350778 [Lindgomyces ingoldianus]